MGKLRLIVLVNQVGILTFSASASIALFASWFNRGGVRKVGVGVAAKPLAFPVCIALATFAAAPKLPSAWANVESIRG